VTIKADMLPPELGRRPGDREGRATAPNHGDAVERGARAVRAPNRVGRWTRSRGNISRTAALSAWRQLGAASQGSSRSAVHGGERAGMADS